MGAIAAEPWPVSLLTWMLEGVIGLSLPPAAMTSRPAVPIISPRAPAIHRMRSTWPLLIVNSTASSSLVPSARFS